MTEETFQNLSNTFFESRRQIQLSKGQEYAGSQDRLANFKRGSEYTGLPPEAICFVYMQKHFDAIASFVKRQIIGYPHSLSEPIEERLKDLANYIDLFWGLCTEPKTEIPTTWLRPGNFEYKEGGNKLCL